MVMITTIIIIIIITIFILTIEKEIDTEATEQFDCQLLLQHNLYHC